MSEPAMPTQTNSFTKHEGYIDLTSDDDSHDELTGSSLISISNVIDLTQSRDASPVPTTAQVVASTARKAKSPPQRGESSLFVERPRTKSSPKPPEDARKKTPETEIPESIISPLGDTPNVNSDSDSPNDQDILDHSGSSSVTPTKLGSQNQSKQKSPFCSTDSASPQLPYPEEREAVIQKVGCPGQKRDQIPPRPRQSVILKYEDLVNSLQGFKEVMENDHRAVTYWKLHDAKLAVEDAPPSGFDESTDPFLSLTTVFHRKEDPLLESSRREYVDHIVFNKTNKSTSKSRKYLAANTFHDQIRRVPNYQSHTNVRRNILTADDENLKYIPYMGEQPKDDKHDQLMEELNDQYVTARTEDIQDFERATKLRVWLTSWLEVLDIGLDQQTLKHYVLTLPRIDARLRIKKKELDLLRTHASYSLDSDTIAISGMFYRAFEEVFEMRLEKVVVPKDQLKEMMEAATMKAIRPSPRKTIDAPNRLGTYVELTCMICAVVDCATHGEFEDEEFAEQDSEGEESPRFQSSQRIKTTEKNHEEFYQRQHSDLALPYPDTLTRYLSYKRTRPEEEPLQDSGPCSEECYISNQSSDRAYQLDQGTMTQIRDMLTTLTDPRYQSCHIAFGLSLPCWQVHAEVSKCLKSRSHDDSSHPTPIDHGMKRPEWYDNKKKTLKNDWKDSTSAHLHQTRFTSNPCGHDGPCIGTCPCVERNILCERFCGCGDDCLRRFTGCSCHAIGLNCVTDHCICIAMNRECGPECEACGATTRIDPANKHHDLLFASGCQNVALQRGVSKKLVMGESQLEGTGFGVYLLQPVRKGEFLSEYTGEVISHAEAERRGIIYDRKLMSFLFDLNSSNVIDAAKMGNKTRFINHASLEKEGLNCEAKIVLVNGEHRIKFIALRDISVGEELLFNYGRKFAEKHGLTVKLPTAKEGNKGVLVGEEALDALDGVTARTKLVRGQMKAVRGRSSGRGGRKAASKIAPKPKVVKETRQMKREPSQDLCLEDVPVLQYDEGEDDYGSPLADEGDEGVA